MTADRLNFDNPALQTGLDAGAVASDFELLLIENRKRVFGNAITSKGSFKVNVFSQLKQYDQASEDAALKAFRELRVITEPALKESYNAGTKSIDARMSAYIKAGHKAKAEKQKDKTAYYAILASTLTSFASSLATAKEQAKRQLLQITSLVDESEDISPQIDRIQSVFLKQGLTVDSKGNNREISAHTELTLRNQSHQLLLQGKGDRQSDYGLHYVQISGHPSSCPLCSPWQLKVVIDDVFSGGVPDGSTPLMSTAISDGLFHYNCRHEFTTYIPGFDKLKTGERDVPSADEVAKRYAVEQQQRYNERQIRDWKKREAAAMTDKEQQLSANKIAEWQAQQRALRDIAEREGIPFYRQYSREQIGGETKPAPKLIYGEKNDIINVREVFYNLPYEKTEHLKGQLDNIHTREYYIRHIENIKEQIDESLPLKEQAKMAFNLRNEARTYSRDLMADQKTRKDLEIKKPNRKWEDIIEDKMKRKNLSLEEAYKDIIESATESNKTVNNDLGIGDK